MSFLAILLQVVLLVLWYSVPAMATVPAVVIFLPLIIVGTTWILILILAAIAVTHTSGK